MRVFGPGAGPDRGLVRADHVRQDDQAPDRLVRLRYRGGGAGDHGVHEPGRGLRAGESLDQLRAPVHRDRVRRHQVHTPCLQRQAVGDRPGGCRPGRGGSPVHPAAPAGHLVQVMLGHRRGLQRDARNLVRGGHAQVSRSGQIRAAPARAGREMRHRLIRASGPGQVRSRGAWLLAGPAPALAALRLRRRRGAAGQVIGGWGHRGIPAVAAQPAPQIPDLGGQRHHVGPQLPDRRGLLRDHLIPGSARRATRCRRWQAAHNRPSSSPALSSQAATPGRL